MKENQSTSRRQLGRAYSLDTAISNRSMTSKRVRFQNDAHVIGRSQIQETDGTMWYTVSRPTPDAVCDAVGAPSNIPPLVQPSELHAIRDGVRNTVRELKKAGDNASALESEHFCRRGVENMQSNGGMSDKRLRTKNMMQGLLDEQNNQRKMGIYDPKGLQVRASIFSKAAIARALLLAKHDEMEALEIAIQTSPVACSSRLSATTFDSKDGSDEESKIECVGMFSPKIDLQHQQKNTSSARSA